MRLATFIFVLSLFSPSEQTVLTGIVSIDGEPMSGCNIKVLETGASQSTDSDGKFRLVVNDMEQVSLLISYADGLTCKVLIRGIKTTSDEVNLGTIPLFFNERISVSEYEKLDKNERKRYDAIRHWTQLIGYINKNSVDTTALRTALEINRKIKYRFDPVDNKVIANYEEWIK
ncbi:MAG: hypothetical protein QM762_13600 [Chryseolinea sp.]